MIARIQIYLDLSSLCEKINILLFVMQNNAKYLMDVDFSIFVYAVFIW